MKTQFIRVGRIVRPRGLKGVVKVQLFCGNDLNYSDLKTVLLDGTRLNVESSQIEGDFAYFKLFGVDTVEQAELLREKELFVERGEMQLKKGSYFVSELLGAQVFVDEKLIGKLADILNYGSADVYVVKTDDGKNITFPALKPLFVSIDAEAGKIVLDGKKFAEVAVFPD